jgi:hypothetical protein
MGQLLTKPRTLVYNLRLTALPDDGNMRDPPTDGGQSFLRTEDSSSCGRRRSAIPENNPAP